MDFYCILYFNNKKVLFATSSFVYIHNNTQKVKINLKNKMGNFLWSPPDGISWLMLRIIHEELYSQLEELKFIKLILSN